MLRKLAVMAGWCGAAFAVQTAFAMTSLDPGNVLVAAAYAVALATTFALHRATRGPPMLGVAFGLGWALAVEGVLYAVVAEETPLRARIVNAILLALPLVALVVRRFATEPEDAWFRRHARRVVAFSLVVALPLLVAGAIGSARADPAPYDRARLVLLDDPFAFNLWHLLGGKTKQSACRFDALRSPTSDVDAAVRNELIGACGRFERSEPQRACECMSDLVDSRSRAEEKRRDQFRYLALLSALPSGLALLFAWRGRRPARNAASSHT